MDESITQALSKYKRGQSCLIARGVLTICVGLAAATDPNWALDMFAGHWDGSSETSPFELETSRPAKLARKCAMIAGLYSCVWGMVMVLSAARGTCDMMTGISAFSMVHGMSCLVLGAIENKSTLFVIALPFILLDIGACVYSRPKVVRLSRDKTLYIGGGAQGLDGEESTGSMMKRVNSHTQLRVRAPLGPLGRKDEAKDE